MISQAQEKRLLSGFRKLAEQRAKFAEHVCNGDPHPGLGYADCDKNANAKAWQADCEAVERLLEAKAEQKGLKVNYPGLYPTFETKEGRTLYL